MYSAPAKKNGSANNPIPNNQAPINVLKALGNLHSAPLIPEAAPRSSSATKPMIID